MSVKANKFFFKVLTTSLFTFAMLTSSGQGLASGFALIENSASGMGNAFAGAAASAKDASTIWFNPAGMMKLDTDHILVVGHIVKPKSDFTNDGSTTASGAALTGEDSKGATTAFIPNLYWVKTINSKMKFGLGVNAPFGSETLYDDTWVGRYNAVGTELTTVNFNPSIAYQVNDKFSVGGGINITVAHLTFTNAVDFGALLGAPGTADGFADLEADNLGGISDLAYSINLGLLYDITPDTSIGVAYRSETKLDVEGEAKFKVPTAAAPVLASGAFRTSDITGSVTLPQSLSLSLSHKVRDLTWLADITWTGWSSFDELKIEYANSKQPDSVTTEDWEDIFRYSVGLDWQYNPKMVLRTGLAYDETPIPNAERRTPRIAGDSRTWLSFGVGYVIDSRFTIDVGYSHLFVDDVKINNTFESSQAALASTVKGSYDTAVDILSVQLRWNY